MLDNEQGQPTEGNTGNYHKKDSVDDNTYNEKQLANETIEQEAELSDHTNAADVDVKDTSEPAPAGQPKSIANDDRD